MNKSQEKALADHLQKQEEKLDAIQAAIEKYSELLSFVRLVAAPKRSDGTYNYCREALEQKAVELIKELGENV